MRKLFLFMFIFWAVSCSKNVPLVQEFSDSEMLDSEFTNKDGTAEYLNATFKDQKGGMVDLKYYPQYCNKPKDSKKCEVNINYSSSSTRYLGKKLTVSLKGYDAEEEIPCNPIGSKSEKCKIILTPNGSQKSTIARIGVEGVRHSTIATFYLNSRSNGNFQISSPLSLAGLNIAEGVLSSVAGSEISSLLGIGSGPSEAQFNALAQQVNQISQTLNQVLNDVIQLKTIETQSFANLTTYLNTNNLSKIVTGLNSLLNESDLVYGFVDEMTLSAPAVCPAVDTKATAPVYYTEQEIAASSNSQGSALPILFANALGCTFIVHSTSQCSSLGNIYLDAENLVGTAQGQGSLWGSQNVAQSLFSAINKLTFSTQNTTGVTTIFEQNNNTVIQYAVLLAEFLQKNYNIMKLSLYLKEYGTSPWPADSQGYTALAGFAQMAFPEYSGYDSNSNYATNLTALNNVYTGYQNTLATSMEQAIWTDNPGNPAVSNGVFGIDNTVFKVSPKVFLSGYPAFPSSSIPADSWLKSCNIYEWSGATPTSAAPQPLQAVCSNGTFNYWTTTGTTTPPTGTSQGFTAGQISFELMGVQCYSNNGPQLVGALPFAGTPASCKTITDIGQNMTTCSSNGGMGLTGCGISGCSQ